ncbi:MAG: phosphoenolpyruvate synthase [Oscillatoriales cyanobacterium RM2_1_1]|nr:phosphoenolpyruvate synthase [Oscillatoriales cyanobacterium SM2_3_0]NJO45787.1 phosphoenolpyruvate synthase [Oscillatoriales cyanobacterium RM2_1_1]
MVNTLVQRQSQRSQEETLVRWLEEVGMADIAQVGGKNASLGEMTRHLKPKGINLPRGFATTAVAYRRFIESVGLDRLRRLFHNLDPADVNALHQVGQKTRHLILNTPFPPDLRRAISQAYQELCHSSGPRMEVAIRSSATAEDLPDASFAGQQESYLNIRGQQGVIDHVHRCFASLFTDRAISYRILKGFDHFEVALSVGIQQMVRSDLATAGVMFSIDPETGFKNAALITAGYGLGENVVQGSINPDEYLVFKPTLKAGFPAILAKRLGTKALKMVYNSQDSQHSSNSTQNLAVPLAQQQQFALSDAEILQLGKWAILIEDYYSQLNGYPTPMDIEWAKDGLTGELFIVQARPETVQSQKTPGVLHRYKLQGTGAVLVAGRAVGDRIGQGTVRLVCNPQQMAEFQPGDVLVTSKTDPDWEPIMKKASAIITDSGGRTCHAAIIARELGIPAIVGSAVATTLLQPGQTVTVSCAEGETGKVYQGLIPFQVEETVLDQLPQTRTQILMNVGNSQEAFGLSAIPCQGVGLARLEFIIANQIKVHPLALLRFSELTDESAKQAITDLTAQYQRKSDYFVDQLTQGVATIAAAFYPHPVIVRMSDFKSNEYANLLGGRMFEPQEENPMLGWRGAGRYTDPNYQAAFGLECQALRRVRDEIGLANVIPMIPFCRTPDQGRKVLVEMAKYGLNRGENGLQVYVMCELPSNVLLADEFCQVFDGFSIGSNDLTQLILGLDRDSGLVADLFDERSPAVKQMIQMAIHTAKKHGRKIGICGQAPSDYPEFAQFLVELGIDSISLNPDSVLKTTLAIAQIENIS